MFLRIEHIKSSHGGRRIIVLKCDQCGSERRTNYAITLENKYKSKPSFCGKECQILSQKNGIIRQQTDKLFLERYGVITPLNMTRSRDKLRVSLYNGGLDKTKNTLQERHGVSNPMQVAGVPEKQQNSIRVKRNGLHHLQTEESLTKKRLTCLERYGVDHPMRNPSVIMDFPFREVWMKSHIKKKENGTYIQSRSERSFGAWLAFVFGRKNIKRGVLINGWSIDFAVILDKATSLYVQYDGVYWHGLDVNKIMLCSRQGARASRIKDTFERDIAQCLWFNENGLLLQRVTDKVFEEYIKSIWQARKKKRQLRAIVK